LKVEEKPSMSVEKSPIEKWNLELSVATGDSMKVYSRYPKR